MTTMTESPLAFFLTALVALGAFVGLLPIANTLFQALLKYLRLYQTGVITQNDPQVRKQSQPRKKRS